VYHLFVTAESGAWDSTTYKFELSRVIKEYTSDDLCKRYSTFDENTINELLTFPALFAYERSNKTEAKLGFINRIKVEREEIVIEYSFFPNMPTIRPDFLDNPNSKLGIETKRCEMYRTHWSVKNIDLLQGLFETGILTMHHLTSIPPEFVKTSALDPFSPSDKSQGMSPEDSHNSGMMLLLLLAQAYYKMLEYATTVPCGALDLELNQSYIWVTESITKLLQNHKYLQNFPLEFAPLLDNLYPSTVRDCDWEDMVAPEAEKFLSTVQKYIITNGANEPEKGSSGWIFIEFYRPAVNLAIQRAEQYNKRMNSCLGKFIKSSPLNPNKPKTSEHKAQAVEPRKQNKPANAFISYSHKDKKILNELLLHLKPITRIGELRPWSDKDIPVGSEWPKEIKENLNSAKVAILLVTKDFLASEFIYKSEFCPLLKSAKEGGLKIVWVLISDCNWKETALANIQAALPTDTALARMGQASRDRAWVTVCDEIKKVL
jgi:hypothetical protein